MFKDVPVPADEQALLLLLSWWLSWQFSLNLILLQDTNITVIVSLVYRLFLLVTRTEVCLPPKVILEIVVKDIIFLDIGRPEVGID